MPKQIRTNFSVTKNQILGVETETFTKDYERDFQLRENQITGETDLNRLRMLQKKLEVAGKNFSGEQNVTLCGFFLSIEMDEHIELARNFVEVIGCPAGKICLTLLHYHMTNQQVQLLKSNSFQEWRNKFFPVNCPTDLHDLGKYFHLPLIMNWVYDELLLNKSFVMSCEKNCDCLLLILVLFIRIKMSSKNGYNRNISSSSNQTLVFIM